MAAFYASFLLFQWADFGAAGLRLLLVGATMGLTELGLSLWEVWSQEKPHPVPRRFAWGAFAIVAATAVYPLFFDPGDPVVFAAAWAALLGACVAYEASYRKILRDRKIDRAALKELYDLPQLRTAKQVTPTLRPAFTLVVAGAAVLAASVGPAFLTILPAAWMVGRVLDPETPLDERFGRGIEHIAWGGLVLALAGALFAQAYPVFNWGGVTGLTPTLMAAVGAVGVAIAIVGARVADREIRAVAAPAA